MKASLHSLLSALGIAVWLTGTVVAQKPASYDAPAFDEKILFYYQCSFLSSPNHQNLWWACKGFYHKVSDELYFLFPVTTDGHLGKKIILNLSAQEWGLKAKDRLIALTNTNQFIWLNLETSEIAFLSADSIQKSSNPIASAIKRQAITNLDPLINKYNNSLTVTNTSILSQDSYLVLLKKPFRGDIFIKDQELAINGIFWMLRLSSKNQASWTAEYIPFPSWPDDMDDPERLDQNFALNNRSDAIFYNPLSPSQTIRCFNFDSGNLKINDQLFPLKEIFNSTLAALPNGNFIINSYHKVGKFWKPYRTILTPACKAIETADWEIDAQNEVEALKVSPAGETFLVYSDYTTLDEKEDEIRNALDKARTNVSQVPAGLYLQKYTKDNKLAWSRELVGWNDPWLPYLNLISPPHTYDIVRYNIQIAFSPDGKSVLVMVYNHAQSEKIRDILNKNPKNLLPRIYRLPIN